ncbi:hypothetical protein FJZ17_02335 [Candidatus Pacearchaeota archaeon]|nr:hypothetical protein [Candidatus Pacearchaeota archaeon]
MNLFQREISKNLEQAPPERLLLALDNYDNYPRSERMARAVYRRVLATFLEQGIKPGIFRQVVLNFNPVDGERVSLSLKVGLFRDFMKVSYGLKNARVLEVITLPQEMTREFIYYDGAGIVKQRLGL